MLKYWGINTNNTKHQIPINNVPKNFISLYLTFKQETSANIQESEQHDLVDQEIETENKLYLAEENLSAQKVEAEVLSWWTSNKKKTLIWLGLQEGIFWHHHLLLILKVYFQKLVTCTNKSEIDCF